MRRDPSVGPRLILSNFGYVKCRYHLLGSLTEDARHLGAAGWADALSETSSIGLFDVTGELTLCLALNAVRLAGVTLSHWDLRLIAEPLGGGQVVCTTTSHRDFLTIGQLPTRTATARAAQTQFRLCFRIFIQR